jgi:hypothetical protein
MWFGVPVENEQATSWIASHLTRKLLPIIQFGKLNRALCLLDPYGLHLDWEVMLQA